MPPRKSKSSAGGNASPSPAPNLDTNIFQVNNAKLMKAFERLTKSLEQVSKVNEDFNSSFQQLSNFTTDEISDMDYQLRLKNEECYNHLQDLTKQHKEKQFKLESEYAEKKYQLETEHSQRIDTLEHEYKDKNLEHAKLVLVDGGYVVMSDNDHEVMQRQLRELKEGRETFETDLRKQLNSELYAKIETQKLRHEVDTSNMKATIENQNREIEMMRNTIDSLKAEIQAQRDLTREVANATQKTLTQNFSK